MIKNMFASVFLSALLLFSGCDTDSEAEESLKSQQMLDDGDYEGVIRFLESKANRSDSENVTLGGAYMAAVNLSFTDLTLMIGDIDKRSSSKSSALRSYDDDSYARFAIKIQENLNENPQALAYLQNAINSFEAVDSNETNEDVELLLGAAQTAQATTVFTYLGDMAKLMEYGVDSELLASSCAIYHVYASPNVALISNPTNDCVQSRILEDSNATDGYRELMVSLADGIDYRRLISQDGKNVILSDGYVGADGNQTYDSANGENFPYMVQDAELTIRKALVMTLNEGFENLFFAAPDEMRADIYNFRNEIDLDGDTIITSEEVSDYIETQINK